MRLLQTDRFHVDQNDAGLPLWEVGGEPLVDLVFKSYAELKQRCRGLYTWLCAEGCEQTSSSPRQQLPAASFELFEPRLFLSSSSTPSIAAPATASGEENTPLVFSQSNSSTEILLTDSGAVVGDNFTITASNGTVTLASSSGLVFTSGAASGSSSVAFSGTVANINKALNGLEFVPASNMTGNATMQFAVTDPTDLESASATTAITVEVPPQTTVENVPLTFSPAHDNALEVASTITDVGISVPDGTLTVPTTSGLTFINGTANGTSDLQFSGTTGAMNAALDGLKMNPATDFTGSDPVTYITAVTSSQPTVFTTDAIPVTVTPAPPTIATPAAASPSPVTGTTTALSVLGADDSGESNLTYTWATTGTPPAAVAFSANGTNAAQDTTATFSAAGTYDFLVTVTDGAGLSTTSSVNVTVDQKLKTITVSPNSAGLNENQTEQFSATAYDQFGNVMASQPTFSWSKSSGVGSINSSGLYTAPGGTGSATVAATSGSISGLASITVTNAAPTVATAAAASPSPVTGTTTALSVLGADDGGASNLTYTWATTGTPPAAVSFSANGTNAAKDTTATFFAAGSYTFQVTITDAGGLSTTSSVSVVVSQQLSEVVVLPSLVSIPVGTTQQCTAEGYDQFGSALATQPTFTWSVTGGGTISQSGLYTAPSVSGDYPIIKATAGSDIGLVQFSTLANQQAVVPPGANTGTAAAVNVAGYSTSYIYTWSVISKPAGAPEPTFSANASSAAYQTTVTFYQAGLYEFVCNFGSANGSGTRYCATFEETVEQTTTSISVSPSTAALNENQTQAFAATADDQFGDVMSPEPAFTWSLGAGAGSISTAGLYTASSSPGSATVKAVSGSVSGTASVSVTNAPPTVATAASASPGSVTGKTSALSVLGADDGGESNLTYTWATTGTPPAAVTFSANGTNAAKNTVATFSKAGSYSFQVTIKDTGGLSTTSSVTVTVSQTLTSMTLSPTSAALEQSGTQQFQANGFDQFGNAISSSPGVTWSVLSGVGTISSGGLYTAPNGGGSATVKGVSGTLSATAAVTITNVPPTVATAAAASPGTVTGTTTVLSVLGADDGGETNLTYTWTTTGIPPAAVAFSLNGTNSAKSTTATFAKAGTYSFKVTITDPGGGSITSSVNVTVSQKLTAIAVSPLTAGLNENQTEQFSATAEDQFGNALSTQPSFTWAKASGIGTISSSGLYTSPVGAGSASITATATVSGTSTTGYATVTVTNAPPTVQTAASASPGTVTGTSTALSVLGADDGGESNLAYSWSVVSKPTGASSPSFTVNGMNAAKSTSAVFSMAGTYVLQATITDSGGLTATSSVSVTVDQTATSIAVSPADGALSEGSIAGFSATELDQFGNAMSTQPLLYSWSSSGGLILATGTFIAPLSTGPITITASSGILSGSTLVNVVTSGTATASPSTVTGTTSTLAVIGGSTFGVTYTWSVISEPSGASAPTFSANGSSAAQSTVATFFAAGDYTFQVAINSGQTTTQSVNVTVNQTLTSISVSPTTANLDENGKQTFSAVGFDQFDKAMVTQPSLSWNVASGNGSIDGGGAYTAGGSGQSGSAVIDATSGGIVGSATVTVTNAAPTIATAAAALPSSVTGTSTTLWVLGADDGGESNLTYTWSTVGSPPAPVTFSSNGSNSAKSTVVSFTKAGTYQFTVTVADAEGLTATSNVTVIVDQTVTTLSLSPTPVTVVEGQSQQFIPAAVDQFGNAIANPALTWSVRSGTGSITSAGLYTATSTSGTTVVTATSGSVMASSPWCNSSFCSCGVNQRES